MKVLFVTKNFRLGAGDRTYMFSLQRVLEKYGHEVGYFAMQHPSNLQTPFSRYFVSQIDFRGSLEKRSFRTAFKVVQRSIYSRESSSRMASLLDDYKPDLVHIQHLDQHLSYSILPVIRQRHIPIVWTLHIYTPICLNHNLMDENTGKICEACSGGRYYKAAIRRCKRGSVLASLLGSCSQYANRKLNLLNCVNVFLCPSEFLMSKFVEFGFPRSRLQQLSYFIDAREGSAGDSGAGYGLFLGRLVHEKGVDLILKALKGIKRPFMIVGDGPAKEELVHLAAEIGLQGVTFAGYKTGKELQEIVSGASFIVVPSRWYEVVGLVILEAYAHGKPAIGSRIGGIPEVIEDGETGLLFEPENVGDLHDKMMRLFEEPELCVAMGKKARLKVVAEYGYESHYDKLMGIYRSVLKGNDFTLPHLCQ